MHAPIRPDARSILFATALGLLLAGCGGGDPEPVRADPAEVVARVYGVEITRGQLDEVVRNERARRPGDAPAAEVELAALESLLGTELMYRAALADGMEIPQEQLDEALEAVRSQFADEEQLAAYLGGSDLTEEALVERTRKRLLVTSYAKRVVVDAEPDGAELREAYEARRDRYVEPEAVHAFQILVRPDRVGEGEANHRKARGQVERARARLLAGESFADVAPEISNGPFSHKGGDMGWFDRSRWIEPFSEVVFELPVGELSDVFRTPLGYHVVRVEAKRPATPRPFEDVRTALTMELMRERRDGALERHVRELLDAADVEILDESLRAAMDAGRDG